MTEEFLAPPAPDIAIPPEAVEAAAKAILKEWTDLNSAEAAARAAILAALRAWPGMQTGSDDGGVTLSGVYLPLNTENSDD